MLLRSKREDEQWLANIRQAMFYALTKGVGWELGCAYTSKLRSVFIVYMPTVYNKRIIILMYSSDCVI